MIMLSFTIILTWKAAQDAYKQIESAEALNVALNDTSDDTRRRCLINADNHALGRDLKDLKGLKDEEGLLCTNDGRMRILWDGTDLIDINCCCEQK